jgi:hypothetical protein
LRPFSRLKARTVRPTTGDRGHASGSCEGSA